VEFGASESNAILYPYRLTTFAILHAWRDFGEEDVALEKGCVTSFNLL
jgi:hypothetical protein